AGKLDVARTAAFGEWREMRQWKFPLPAGTMLLAARQDFRGEHAIDLEKLEFHRVAASGGPGINERQPPTEATNGIRPGFGDENRHVDTPQLTVSKVDMAKRRLTGRAFHGYRNQGNHHCVASA